MNASANDDPSLWDDLKDIWEKAKLLALIILLPTLTVSAIIALAFEPVRPVLTVIFGTWPLVASVTVLILMIMRKSLQHMSGHDKIYSIGACIVIPYLIAYFTGATGYGDLRGAETGSWIQLLHPAHLLMLVFNILVYYFSAFGLLRLANALLCGSFLAWALQIKLLPHVQRLTAKA